ncbi:32d47f56-b61b-4914-af33-11debf7c489f [Thermothielavioides terrestris]|uniref:32d47f56-b61b-4914-af33-11debf7c489f n=1 Tax=Thermothielavioides terrestris TaxID=2587410 RepID=A0A3S4D8D3_9PEZI|nr:32d47f56-b61b-4914-af33-11debf7c489f [Thermothielavioides terrestris]
MAHRTMKPKLAVRRPRILRSLLSRSTLQKLALAFFVWNIIEAHLSYYRIARAEQESKAQAVLREPIRVYIASLHWNNEKILRSDWNQGVVDLVKALGPENTFVSVYESGSWDNSKDALRELDRELEKTGVGKKIVLDDATHADLISKPPSDGEEGWITIPDGRKALRRIPYLSNLRNLSLQPLLELAENGTTFDYVLFLGDVVFSVSDVIALLKTNKGHYAAACSLDFSKPPLFYDTFALRDAHGHVHASQTWPYFRASASRNAMVSGQPVPVTSCWNGIVAMPASTFTGLRGLRFRGLPDSLAAAHLEASECCLIHADNPASRSRGVFLNPAVRVGYSRAAYDRVVYHALV